MIFDAYVRGGAGECLASEVSNRRCLGFAYRQEISMRLRTQDTADKNKRLTSEYRITRKIAHPLEK